MYRTSKVLPTLIATRKHSRGCWAWENQVFCVCYPRCNVKPPFACRLARKAAHSVGLPSIFASPLQANNPSIQLSHCCTTSFSIYCLLLHLPLWPTLQSSFLSPCSLSLPFSHPWAHWVMLKAFLLVTIKKASQAFINVSAEFWHSAFSASEKSSRTPCHSHVLWHLGIQLLAQNCSSMLTGTAKCTAKDQESTVENWVSGQMFSTESTVERIYKFSEKHVKILVASKYYEILTPGKHILFLHLHDFFFLKSKNLNLRLKKPRKVTCFILKGIFIFLHHLPKPLPSVYTWHFIQLFNSACE